VSNQLNYLSKGAVLLLLFCSAELSAQNSPNVVVTDSIETAFLPALSFKSDLGFLAGGMVQRFHYAEKVKPFYSSSRIVAVASTKGLASFLIEFDKPDAFNTNYRLTNSLIVSRFLQDNYYGIGSYEKIENSFNASTNLYSFNSFTVGVYSELRVPTYKTSKNQLDVLTFLNFDYETPWDNDSSSLISQQQPIGFKGGRSVNLGLGLIWENRNSEFRPTSGNFIESSFESGQNWWGSSYNSYAFKFDVRQYYTFNFIKNITFANRLFTKQTFGDTPYWKLAYAGDEETLRGYPSKRFMDDNLILFNTELRTWLFNIDAVGGEFGGTLFFDVGRTYPNGESFDNIFNDLKYSYGLGGTSSFFTPDFILRCDVGFSEEGVGVYFTAGYMF